MHGNPKIGHEVIVKQAEKNVLFEEFADLSTRMKILIVKNTDQIARNCRNLNIQEPHQIQVDEMREMKDIPE